MTEPPQESSMIMEDTKAGSPTSMPEDDTGEAKTSPSADIDIPHEQMVISSQVNQAPSLPRLNLFRRVRKSFFSENLEVFHWEKQNVRLSGSVAIHQKHTFFVMGKAKVALQAQRIRNLQERLQEREKTLNEHEKDVKCLKETLVKTTDEASDTEVKLALALREAADAKFKLAERESDHRDTTNNLKHHNEALAAQITSYESRIVELEVAKSNTQPFANSRKVSDDSIQSAWARLKYTINNIASNILIACPTQEDLEDTRGIDNSCVLSSIHPEHIKQLQDEDMRPFVIQHYIWKAVIGRVFEPGPRGHFGKSWGGTVGMCFMTCFKRFLMVCREKGREPNDLLHWEAETGQMIEQMIGVDETELLEVISKEFTAFSKFIPKASSNYQAKCEKLRKGLRKIFDEALQLHAITGWTRLVDPG